MEERYGRLLARARMLAASAAEAEDLVQDALIATFGKPRTFASVPAAEQYVRRAIVTTYLNASAKGVSERARALRTVGDGVSRDHAPSVEGRIDLIESLSALPPRVRACIVLRYLEDLSIAETARLLDLTDGAVKRYVSDGLKVLNANYGLTASAHDEPHAAVSVTKEPR